MFIQEYYYLGRMQMRDFHRQVNITRSRKPQFVVAYAVKKISIADPSYHSFTNSNTVDFIK